MGGGRTAVQILPGKGPVSNPLGWEGDLEERHLERAFCLVSNPLGWEGDVEPDRADDRRYRVSNPLGWEGDSATAGASRKQSEFLIH